MANKNLKKLLSLFLTLLMLMSLCITAFCSDASNTTTDETGALEDTQIKLSKYGINLSIPMDYYFCYEDNAEDFKDYFNQIGWDYDETMSTMKQQGIELFGFSNDNKREFYVIVEEDYDYYNGINLKDCNEEEYTLALDRYLSAYFNDYSMLDLNETTTAESDQALYVVDTYEDYTGSTSDSSSSVFTAEYWTTLNGYSFRFLLYDVDSLYSYEELLAELKTIMDTVTFDEVLTQEQVQSNVNSEKRAETLKIIFVALATLVLIALIVFVVIIIVRGSKKRKVKALAAAKAEAKNGN